MHTNSFLSFYLLPFLPPHPLPTHTPPPTYTPPPTHQPGRLKSVKALGWYLEEQDVAQVSMNLTDFETTPLHVAFEECCKDARVRVTKPEVTMIRILVSLPHTSHTRACTHTHTHTHTHTRAHTHTLHTHTHTHMHTHTASPLVSQSCSSWVRDCGAGPSEGHAHVGRTLHPTRKLVSPS